MVIFLVGFLVFVLSVPGVLFAVLARRRTLRPRNLCTSCDYEWFPRGRDLSEQCPQCGSADVMVKPFPWKVWAIGSAMWLGLSLLLAFYFMFAAGPVAPQEALTAPMTSQPEVIPR
jgi:hypothetical protein